MRSPIAGRSGDAFTWRRPSAVAITLLLTGCSISPSGSSTDGGLESDTDAGGSDAGGSDACDSGAVSFSIATHDGTLAAPFGSLGYRVYYPVGFRGSTNVIHVSRGGTGAGDDRVGLPTYVDGYVRAGYVVVTVDHRWAGNDVEQIARLRGEEIASIGGAVATGDVSYGAFEGSVDGAQQGFAGHSGGCMEGLMAVGTAMTHGSYTVPSIRALYCMSPAGYMPDQFGIQVSPPGHSAVGDAWVFVVVGEQESDTNGTGVFQADGWRLQAFDAMTDAAPRFEALIRGEYTTHLDVVGDNPAIAEYNLSNSTRLFEAVLRGADCTNDIGRLALPPSNVVTLDTKGL
jgi:hypothetical protein